MTRINIFEVVKASRNDIDIKMCVSGQIMPEDLYRQWAQQVIAELQLIRQNEWRSITRGSWHNRKKIARRTIKQEIAKLLGVKRY